MSRFRQTMLHDDGTSPEPMEAADEQDEADLWFMPAPFEDEPNFLVPGPQPGAQETAIIDGWRAAEAGQAAQLAHVAARLGILDERLRRLPCLSGRPFAHRNFIRFPSSDKAFSHYQAQQRPLEGGLPDRRHPARSAKTTRAKKNFSHCQSIGANVQKGIRAVGSVMVWCEFKLKEKVRELNTGEERKAMKPIVSKVFHWSQMQGW